MREVLQTLCAICIVQAVQGSAGCTLQDGCSKVSESKVSCTGITTFPDCVPNGVTSLTITLSPNLTHVDIIPSNITYLSMSNTGVTIFSSTAISNALMLKTLRITENAALKTLDMGEPEDEPPLKNLYLANCSKLQDVEDLNRYTRLTSITISYCDLKKISDDQFEGLDEVEFLDISHNHDLASIDEDAFEDMDALKYLNMTDCKLTKLYGEYFDNAYPNNLELVSALLNPYQCLEMCDFMEWYWKNRGFYQIALIGTCTVQYDYEIYVDTVYNLGRYGAGCPSIAGIVLGATLGAFFLISLTACIFVAACGIDYRKYFCCCRESQRNRQLANSSESGNDRSVPDYVYNVQADKAGIRLPEQMYTAAPPSYDDLMHPDIQIPTDSFTFQNGSAESPIPAVGSSIPDADNSTT